MWQPIRPKSCASCRFWISGTWEMPSTDEIHPDAEGECRRYPPVLNPTVIEQAVKIDEEKEYRDETIPCELAASMVVWVNPVTTAENFCGEWQAIDDKEKQFRISLAMYANECVADDSTPDKNGI